MDPIEGPHVDEKLEAFRKAVQVVIFRFFKSSPCSIFRNLTLTFKSTIITQARVLFQFSMVTWQSLLSHIFSSRRTFGKQFSKLINNHIHFQERSLALAGLLTKLIYFENQISHFYLNFQWEIPGLDKHETIDVNGISRINVHYYEDGNVQLSAKKDLTAQVKYSNDPVETAKNLIAAIEKAETTFEVCNFGKFYINYQYLAECHSSKLRCNVRQYVQDAAPKTADHSSQVRLALQVCIQTRFKLFKTGAFCAIQQLTKLGCVILIK